MASPAPHVAAAHTRACPHDTSRRLWTHLRGEEADAEDPSDVEKSETGRERPKEMRSPAVPANAGGGDAGTREGRRSCRKLSFPDTPKGEDGNQGTVASHRRLLASGPIDERLRDSRKQLGRAEEGWCIAQVPAYRQSGGCRQQTLLRLDSVAPT